jgi:4-hydroxy-tetrahydrodipicolinate reductase
MIKVFVNGFRGRMGAQVIRAVSEQDDMVIVGGFDPAFADDTIELDGTAIAPAFAALPSGLAAATPDVLVDFTSPSSVEDNLRIALTAGVDCVVGTTGLTPQKLQELAELAPERTALFHAPNFTLGAVLMMAFSRKAARYFPDVEVIEFHHNGKKDAPSGTAITTALGIAQVRVEAGIVGSAPGKETELPGREGARGADVEGVPVHAVRGSGFVAHQEVIFASPGETLTLRHDSIDRSSYMPGVLLAIREVGGLKGLVIGLEQLLDL